MPNTYKLYVANNVGTGANTIRASVAASTQVVCLSLTLCNTTAAQVKGRVFVTRSAVDYDVHGLVEIPPGQSFVSIGESQKLVLETGDELKVIGDTASSLDCLLSTLEVTA